METTITPYALPDTANHSFFFVNADIPPALEAPLHRHDAWELLCVMHGHGTRTAGDTVHPFAAGEVALIPPSMIHCWAFSPDAGNEKGHIRYLMVAFSHQLVEHCLKVFPELRNRLAGVSFPVDALRFGPKSAGVLRDRLLRMLPLDELDRLCEMLRLLPELFTASDRVLAGRSAHIDHNVQRMQRVCIHVMRHYSEPISLDDIASEAGMNRSAFCTWFKRCRGMTFSRFLARYRLDTACALLVSSEKQVSEICYLVGFNDLPHFVRMFKRDMGMSPSRWRKLHRS